jgi:hypothetical protein
MIMKQLLSAMGMQFAEVKSYQDSNSGPATFLLCDHFYISVKM